MPQGVTPFCNGGKEVRKIDSVGRISIPTSFRSKLGSTVYLLKSLADEPCIFLYTEEGWNDYYDGLSDIYEGAVLTHFQRMSVDSVDMSIVDKAGRISLRSDFLEFIGTDSQALVICYPDRIEIWGEHGWDGILGNAPTDSADLAKWSPTPKRK